MPEPEKATLTAEALAEQISGAVTAGVKEGLAGLDAQIDAKLAALKAPPAKAAEGEEVPPDKAVTNAEPKDAEFERTGGYGKGPGAFGRFCLDVYRHSKAIHDGFSPPERLMKWMKFVAQTKPTMQEGDDEQGGFLVPGDVGAHLPATSLEPVIAEAHGARMYNLRGNRINVTADVDATHAGTFFGGVTLYRPSEGGVKTASKPTYRQMTLTLHKLIAFVDVTDELLEDASVLALETDISTKCTAAIQFQKDSDFINGTGVGQALGLLSAITPGGPVISVAARPAQAVTTIIWENVIDMWSRLHPRSAGNAIYGESWDVPAAGDHEHGRWRGWRPRVAPGRRRGGHALRDAHGSSVGVHREMPGAGHRRRHHPRRLEPVPYRTEGRRRAERKLDAPLLQLR